AAARLLTERDVGLVAEAFHVDFFREEREAVRFQLREIEAVADEPLEPDALTRDHVERGGTRLRVLRDSFAQSVHVTADRGERRAELVRDAHQEVAFLLLGDRQSCGHLPEAVGKLSDLTTAFYFRQIDVVVASRDFVARAREREDGRRDPSGQIPPELPRDEDSPERGDRQPLQEWN